MGLHGRYLVKRRDINKKLVNNLLDEATKSITDDVEHAFIGCGNGKIKPIWNLDGSNAERVQADISDEAIAEFCGKNSGLVFHTHSNASGKPSSSDVVTSEALFKDVKTAKASCSVGNDGIFCIDRDGTRVDRLFNDKEMNKLVSKSGMQTWKGDTIFCDKIDKEPNERFFCVSQAETKKGEQVLMGIFDEVSMAGGMAIAGLADADVGMYSDSTKQAITCFGSNPPGKGRLACILRPTRRSRS